MEKLTKSLEETRTVASHLGEIITKHKADGALVVGLNGDLGAGKTAFTKEFATIVGIKDTVVSPTFVLERIYKIPEESVLDSVFDKFIHIDAYRLSGGSELKALGWDELTSNPRNLIFIEWPEQVRGVLPKDMMNIYFEFIDENTRRITTPNC